MTPTPDISPDRYLSLKSLSVYSSISISSLRHHIRKNGLPCYRVPGAGGNAGKILVRRAEFDQWMSQFAFNSKAEIDRLANEALGNL